MRNWTEEEDTTFRRWEGPVKELAKLLNRTEGSIYARARKLGVPLKKIAKKPHWTDKEIDQLKKYYETGSREDLQKLFPDRNWGGISHKGRRLQQARASVTHYLRPRSVGELTHDQRAYLAGLLDGEGTITISVRKNKADPLKGGSPITPLITITNTNKELIDHLHAILNGSTIKTHGRLGIGDKDVWVLQIARILDVKALLEQIAPYLFVKKRQAGLLLEFCNLRLQDKWMRYNPRLFEIAKEIRKLNRKGKPLSGTSSSSPRAFLSPPSSWSAL